MMFLIVYDNTTNTFGSVSAFYSDFYSTMIYGTRGDVGTIIINEDFASMLSEDSIIGVIGTDLDIVYEDSTYTYTITGIYEDNSSKKSLGNALMSETDLNIVIDDYDLNTNVLYVSLTNVSYVTTVIDDLQALGYNTYQDDTSAQQVINYIKLGTKVLTGVGSISMVVASIMIFIVLYISIVERTKEIGILRAIGAQKVDIRHMFLFEAGMLGAIGGILGVVIAFVISIMTNSITSLSLKTNLISYYIPYYLLGIFLSVLVSLLAGIAPSLKASELDPVDALRFE